MSFGQSGQGRQSEGPGGQYSGQNGVTSTFSQQSTTTAASLVTSVSSHTTSTSTALPTSTSPSSSSNIGVKTAVLSGVVGGLGFLLIISVLAIFFLQERNKRQRAVKNGTIQPVTYADLNEAMSGVPFDHSNQSQSGHLVGSSNDSNGIGMRDGADSPSRTNSADRFLPSYAESQFGMTVSGISSHARLNSAYRGTASDHHISPVSTHTQDTYPASHQTSQDADTIISSVSRQTTTQTIRRDAGATVLQPQLAGFNEHAALSPQFTEATALSPQNTGVSVCWTELSVMESQHTGGSAIAAPPTLHDTMGFPTTTIPIDEFVIPLPILSPKPRHPRVQQMQLERAAGNVQMVPEVDLGLLRPQSRDRTERDSGVLGALNPVRMQGPPFTHAKLGRNSSQRTVDSGSSLGIDIVSDVELERLGLGRW